MTKEYLKTKAIVNQRPKKKETDYLMIANRTLSLMIVVAGVIFLGGTNDLAIKHFVVQENKRKLFELRDANRELESKAMSLSSFSSIEKKVDNLKMVKVDKIDYVNLNQVVAKR